MATAHQAARDNARQGGVPARQPAPQRMTFEEYLRLPEEKGRCEFVAGWVLREPSPGSGHQAVVMNLAVLLWGYCRRTRKGVAFVAPFDVVLSRDLVVQPDLLYVAAERTAIITERNVQGPPDLVVEVVSPFSRRKDRLLRLEQYVRHGVREVWLADPARRTLEVFAPAERAAVEGEPHYMVAGTFAAGERIRSRVLPDLACDAAEIFWGSTLFPSSGPQDGDP